MITNCRSKKKFAAAIVAAVLLSACGSESGNTSSAPVSNDEQLTLRLGVHGLLDYPGQASAAFAVNKDMIKEFNLNVTVTTVSQPSDCAAAIAGGSLDACVIDAFGAVPAMDSIQGLKLVAQLTPSNVHYLIGQPSVKSLADLKGKKIGAASPTSGLTIATKNLLKTKGYNPDDSTFVAFAGSVAVAAAFQEKQVDAAVVIEPYQAKFPTSTVLANTGEATPTFTALISRPGEDSKVDAAVVRFIQSVMNGVKYIVDPDNREDVVNAWTSWVNIPKGPIEKQYDDYATRGNFTKSLDTKFKVDSTNWASIIDLSDGTSSPETYIDDSLRTKAFG